MQILLLIALMFIMRDVDKVIDSMVSKRYKKLPKIVLPEDQLIIFLCNKLSASRVERNEYAVRSYLYYGENTDRLIRSFSFKIKGKFKWETDSIENGVVQRYLQN